jgi:hypothetical protein
MNDSLMHARTSDSPPAIVKKPNRATEISREDLYKLAWSEVILKARPLDLGYPMSPSQRRADAKTYHCQERVHDLPVVDIRKFLREDRRQPR